ncbi:lysophospholipid acyltransferase family protein [Paenibacillus sp. YPG26]|uniref:lysophospholipid acyltransferase family protein n=1 Tax=Paenibacillus sp. YPG26 TaxID=2878915 RepID=UPI00203AF805|nr:lysophospholipid acyltransferase family protein [Paenibacillus sp. YPG26]USB32904.1 lysophospholipid acyltransferase family protein [Paenibacillus sp. YPG26]
MLKADKSAAFQHLFDRYNRSYLLSRHFRSIAIKGQLDCGALNSGRPIMYVMNHTSWWDGLLVYHAIRRQSAGDHYMMMEEEQLQKYRFFRRLGAFSINSQSPGSLRSTLKYTEQLLSREGRVWIFPQGEMLPLESRPLEFRRGVGYLLERCPETVVIPVTLYHGLFLGMKPDAYMRVGTPVAEPWGHLGSSGSAQLLCTRLETELNLHKAEILEARGELPIGYALLLNKSRSTNEIYDEARRRVGL